MTIISMLWKKVRSTPKRPNAHKNRTVYFGLATGERPDKMLVEMRHVAKKENALVQVEKVSSRTLLLFYSSVEKKAEIRVRRGDKVIVDHVPPVGEGKPSS